LAERALQARRKARAVGAELALGDDRALVLGSVLDRVLDGDDVAVGRAVDVVDHGGERGGLAAAGGAGDEDESAPFRGDALDDRRQAELADLPHARRDQAQRGLHLTALVEDVDAETPELGVAVARVHLQPLAELLRVVVTQELLGESAQRVTIEARRVRPRDQVAAHPEDGMRTGLEMNVRRLADDALAQDGFELHFLIPFRPSPSARPRPPALLLPSPRCPPRPRPSAARTSRAPWPRSAPRPRDARAGSRARSHGPGRCGRHRRRTRRRSSRRYPARTRCRSALPPWRCRCRTGCRTPPRGTAA